jgi:hypothetical protein
MQPGLAMGGAAPVTPTTVITAQMYATGGAKPPLRIHDDMTFVTNPYYAAGTTGTILGASVATPPTGAGSGAVALSTTAGAANGAVMTFGYSSFLGRYSVFRGRIGFWLPNLSDGTDTYTVYIGAWSTAGLAPSRQCIYLKYTHGTNSGKFQVLTNNGGTTTDTGVTVAANTFYIFDWTVTVNAPDTANNTVSWTLYSGAGAVAASGTGVVTAATNTAGSQECGALAAEIVKSLGTTARTLQVDFWEFEGLY